MCEFTYTYVYAHIYIYVYIYIYKYTYIYIYICIRHPALAARCGELELPTGVLLCRVH